MADSPSTTNGQKYSLKTSNRRFSVNYIASSQIKFLKHLEDGQYDEAAAILEHLPRGQNRAEDIERLVVIAEGYKMLYHELVDDLDGEDDEDDEDERDVELSGIEGVLRRSSL